MRYYPPGGCRKRSLVVLCVAAPATDEPITSMDFGDSSRPPGGSREAPFGWPGDDFAGGCGLYTAGARHYDPRVGRWLSQDPLGYEAGDEDLYPHACPSSAEAGPPRGV